MKAVVCTNYGAPEVLQLKDIENVTPRDNEVLIKVYATSVNYGDLIARNFKNITPDEFNMPLLFWLMAKVAFGLRKPRINIFGSEFSGEIVETGKLVTKFKKGDPVFGYRGQNMGAYAEYMTMHENGVLTEKPANISYEEAAVIPYGSIMALNLLRKMNLKPGQRVLIIGASGGIGSAAVQIAKHFGAEVTGVCGTPRLEFVKSLGASEVIDYTKDDFTQNGVTYDLIFDILGKSSFSRCKSSLTQNGRLLFASFKLKQLLQMLFTSAKSQRVICAIAPGSVEDLLSVKKLIEEGEIKVTIDKRFSIEKAAEAHRYVEEGLKKGNVVITFNK